MRASTPLLAEPARTVVAALGPTSAPARWLIPTFYQRITQPPAASTGGAFAQWEQALTRLPGNRLLRLEQDTVAGTAELNMFETPVEAPAFLFAAHTYFVLVARLLAAELLVRSDPQKPGAPSFLASLSTATFDRIFRELCRLEDGRLFRDAGLETPDSSSGIFSWYLDGFDQAFALWMATLARALQEVLDRVFAETPARDVLKDLYQALVPKRLRAALGEFYTPDWLADLVLDEVGYQGEPGMTLLDPACGSGTFLVQALARVAGPSGAHDPSGRAERLGHALRAIAGFDLNPVAVEAARASLLLHLAPVLPLLSRPIRLPVSCADAIVTPREEHDLYGHVYRWTTPGGDVDLPAAAVQGGWLLELLRVAEQLETKQDQPFPASKFLEAATLRLGGRVAEAGGELIGRCGQQWSRAKATTPSLSPDAAVAACAPLRLGKVDRVVGNPPWIRWRALGPEYRQATLPLWGQYGLFPLKGLSTILGSGEKDFSMLFTYRCADRYLKAGGLLGFLLTMEALRSKSAGQGFRRFRLGEQGDFLKVHRVHDLVAVAPFSGVGNKTGLLVLERGARTTYPVPYCEWRPGAGRVSVEGTLEEVRRRTTCVEKEARPLGQYDAPWRVIERSKASPRASDQPEEPGEPDATDGEAAMEGTGAYRAYRGASTEPYGVYRVRLKTSPRIRTAPRRSRSAVTVTVENLPEQGKRDVPKVTAEIESALLYPAIRGSDIHRWHAAAEICVVMPHDPVKRAGFSEEWLHRTYPKTYAYLLRFKKVLQSRASQALQHLARRSSFYAMYGIGPYTLSRYKVIWQRQANDLHAAVVGPVRLPGLEAKPAIPTDTTALIPAASLQEAHYLCGILNAAVIRSYVRSFTSAGRGFGAPSILEHVKIPRFDPRNGRHTRIAGLSQRAHRLAHGVRALEASPRHPRAKPSELEQAEWELDDLVRAVFRHRGV